jgi:hypothetical protein
LCAGARVEALASGRHSAAVRAPRSVGKWDGRAARCGRGTTSFCNVLGGSLLPPPHHGVPEASEAAPQHSSQQLCPSVGMGWGRGEGWGGEWGGGGVCPTSNSPSSNSSSFSTSSPRLPGCGGKSLPEGGSARAMPAHMLGTASYTRHRVPCPLPTLTHTYNPTCENYLLQKGLRSTRRRGGASSRLQLHNHSLFRAGHSGGGSAHTDSHRWRGRGAGCSRRGSNADARTCYYTAHHTHISTQCLVGVGRGATRRDATEV